MDSHTSDRLDLVRMLALVALVFTTGSLTVSAQEHHPYLSVGVVPTYMFDHITPSIGLEVEVGLMPQLRLALMYGLDINQKTATTSRFESSEHYELKLTGKYLFWQSERLEQYFAIDVFGTWQDAVKLESEYYREGEYYSYTRAEIDRVVTGIRYSYGLRWNVTGRLWIDSFVGIGARTVRTSYTTVGEELEPSFNLEWFSPYEINAGERRKFAAILGVKMEYQLL